MLWYSPLKCHTQMSYRILNKDLEKINSLIRWIGSISGDVKVGIYCDHHVRLTMFCIFLAWIESNFVFGHVIPFGIGVDVQVRPKEGHGNALMFFWDRKSMVTLVLWSRALSYWIIPSVGQWHSAYVATKYRLYNVESLNFFGHALGLFCGCRILLHITTLPTPNLSTSSTQTRAKLSFRRLYTRIRPSHLWRRKRD